MTFVFVVAAPFSLNHSQGPSPWRIFPPLYQVAAFSIELSDSDGLENDPLTQKVSAAL
jgi:hypothetical protein